MLTINSNKTSSTSNYKKRVTGPFLSKLNKPDPAGNGLIPHFARKELKILILSLLVKSPMCGRDIQIILNEKFNLLISPGTLYPLLHNLNKKDLIKCRHGIKTKIYYVSDKIKIKKILNKNIQAQKFLFNFLEDILNESFSDKRGDILK